MIITGSTAIKHWYNDFREVKDLDLIVETLDEEYFSQTNESHYLPSYKLLKEKFSKDNYLTPEGLLSLKISHAGWPIKVEKTFSDILFLLRKNIKPNVELITELRKYWVQYHGKRPIYMNTSNDNFFDDFVKRKLNHDELHYKLAFYDKPMNEKIRKDLSSPLCSEELFNNLSEGDKLKCALEEIMVIAVERFNLNDKSKNSDILIAYCKAYRKLISEMTSGWFNIYMLLNLDKIDSYKSESIKHIKERIK